MTQPSRPAPAHAVRTRFLAPDVARGLMLLFIALANVVTAWAPAPEGMVAGSIGGVKDGSLADKIVVVFGAMFVHVRGLPMFATLLGFGVGMISLSLLRRGYPRKDAQMVLLRRYGWLMFFGAIHTIFLFFGDIMFSYGICGLVLTGLIAVGNKNLRRLAAELWIWGGIIMFLLSMTETEGMGNAESYLAYMLRGLLTLVNMVVFSPLLLLSLLPPMIVGLLMARMLMLHDVPVHRRALTIWAGIAAGFILLVGLPRGLAEIGVLPASWVQPLFALNEAAGQLTGPGLVAAIALAVQPAQRRLQEQGTMNPAIYALVALGKRSMSGYVAQSVLFFLFVLPFTLNLAEGMGAAGKSLIAVGVWALTLAAAVLLERAGKPGPLESVHRRLSYGKAGLPEQWRPQPGRDEQLRREC